MKSLSKGDLLLSVLSSQDGYIQPMNIYRASSVSFISQRSNDKLYLTVEDFCSLYQIHRFENLREILCEDDYARLEKWFNSEA